MEGRKEILLTFPYPAQLTCELCPAAALGRTFRDGRQRGVFKGDRRHEDYVKHLKHLHKDEYILTFKCGRCDYEGEGAYPRRAITAHYQKTHGSPAPGEGLGAVPPGQGRTGSQGTLPASNNRNSRSSNGGGPSTAPVVAATTTAAITITTTTTTTTTTINRNSNNRNNNNNNSNNNNSNINNSNNIGNNSGNSSKNNSTNNNNNNNSNSSGGGSTTRAEGARPRIISVVNLGPKTVRVAGKGVTRKSIAPTTQTKLNIKAMPVRPRAATVTTTSIGATVSSPPAVSTPPPAKTTTRTTTSTSTNTRMSAPRKSPVTRTPPALVGQAAPLAPRTRSSGGPTTSVRTGGAISTKTPPHTTQGRKVTPKAGQEKSKDDSQKKKAPAAPVKPSVGRRAPEAPPATRRITRAAAAALRLQKSGGEEPSIHDISTAKEKSGARTTSQGPAHPRRSIVTGALIRQKSSLGSTPRLRSSARLRGMPAATYAEIAAGRAVSTPITTLGGAEKRTGGETPSTPPQAAINSLVTLTTATTTTTSCGGSIISPGVVPTNSPGASPRMSPVPSVAPINNLVPHGRDPGPGFPPLTPPLRREGRRAEKKKLAASPEGADNGAQDNEGEQQGPSGGAEEEGAAAGRTPSPAPPTGTAATGATVATSVTTEEAAQEEDWRVVGRGRKRACASPPINNNNVNMRGPGGLLSPSTGCGRSDITGGLFLDNNIFFNLNRNDDGGLH
ncbi:hypothetical protein KPH14_012869, partial [Odynerus spinipes]